MVKRFYGLGVHGGVAGGWRFGRVYGPGVSAVRPGGGARVRRMQSVRVIVPTGKCRGHNVQRSPRRGLHYL